MAAFNTVVTTLRTNGYTPTFNVTDNQAAAEIKKFGRSNNITV